MEYVTREDVPLESGQVLPKGQHVKVVAEEEDYYGIEWHDEDGEHLATIECHKLDVARPASVPKEGVVETFDAGWEAHFCGLGRETVAVLTSNDGWALAGYDVRQALTR